MTNSAALRNVKQVIIQEAQSDVVGLWAVLSQVKQNLRPATDEDAKTATLAVVGEALAEQALVAGEFVERDNLAAEFVPWSMVPEEALARIRREWDELGREPDIGEIAWFVDRTLLPVHARRNPMGDDWRPT
jgi:hypothetical protein